MSVIEKIRRYVAETNAHAEDDETYCIYVSEIKAFYEEMNRDAYEAICLIFNYGLAKGYRAAKAEAKRS